MIVLLRILGKRCNDATDTGGEKRMNYFYFLPVRFVALRHDYIVTGIPVIVDGQAGIFAHSKARVATLNAKAKERLCLMDARIRTLMAEPEEGAATAEYAVVLVAATGFAAVLVAILKSDAIKTLLTNIIKQALKVG